MMVIMALHLYDSLRPETLYYDKRSGLSEQEYFKRLCASCTVYVGNLSVYTPEEMVYALFTQCGEVKDVIMGTLSS